MPHHEIRPVLRKSARKMRKAMTDAELKFWNTVRAHRLMGLSFRRQMPISGFIVDFACPEHKIVVEIDGSGHGRDETRIADVQRSEKLAALGWTTIRFWNDDVLKDVDGVCTHILRVVERNGPEEKSSQEFRICP